MNAIAQRHAISAEAVKWRLHAGREKIRERMEYMEKTYDKITMHVMCKGSFGPDRYLGTQVYKAIAKACYDRPLTIEEISLATGIPTLYLEEALEHMVFGDAIEKNGQKYSTCFLITNQAQRSSMRRFLNGTVVAEVADRILDYIGETEEILRELDFMARISPCPACFTFWFRPSCIPLPNGCEMKYPICPSGVRFAKTAAAAGLLSARGWTASAKAIRAATVITTMPTAANLEDSFIIGLAIPWMMDWTRPFATRGSSSTPSDRTALASSRTMRTRQRRLPMGCVKIGRAEPIRPYAVFTEKQYSDFCQWAAQCTTVDSIWKQWIASLFQAYRMVAPKRLADGRIGGNGAPGLRLQPFRFCFEGAARPRAAGGSAGGGGVYRKPFAGTGIKMGA